MAEDPVHVEDAVKPATPEEPLPPLLVIDEELSCSARLKNEKNLQNITFTLLNYNLLLRSQWGISREAYTLIRAAEAFTFMAFLVVVSIRYGSDFLLHLNKLVFLVQTYCCVSWLALSIVYELRSSHERALILRKQNRILQRVKKVLNEVTAPNKLTDDHLVRLKEQMTKLDAVLPAGTDRKDSYSDDDPIVIGTIAKKVLKVTWFLRTVSNDYAFTITVMYYVKTHYYGYEAPYVDLLTDLANSFQVMLGLLIGSEPVRLYHVVWSYLFGCLYLLFTLFVHVYEYEPRFLPMEANWNEFDLLFFAFYMPIGVTVSHLFIFLVYSIRVGVYVGWYTNKYLKPKESNESNV